MTLFNVIDSRKYPYKFRKINAIVEATWHDNSVEGSDHSEKDPTDDGPDYKQKEHITVQEAFQWANNFKNPVTLYIYDEDGGIYPNKDSGT